MCVFCFLRRMFVALGCTCVLCVLYACCFVLCRMCVVLCCMLYQVWCVVLCFAVSHCDVLCGIGMIC